MEGGLRIERLPASALELLQPLWLQLHAHHQRVAPQLGPYVDPISSWSGRRTLYAHAIDTGGSILLAQLRGNNIGYLVTSREPSPWPATFAGPAPLTELVTIHVDDRWRGQGIGSRLLDAFDAELTRTGVRDCFLGAIPANTRAIDLYVVMLTDSNVIQACQQRGFLPGWLQLRRDLCQDS